MNNFHVLPGDPDLRHILFFLLYYVCETDNNRVTEWLQPLCNYLKKMSVGLFVGEAVAAKFKLADQIL